MGRVLGDSGEIESTPGDTLVTSIDANVQAYAEKQLHQAMLTARTTTDTVTGRKYEADSGSVVVLEAKTGRVVAMASQPTYDPEVWSGGITSKQLNRLYSEKASTPLLFRATQGQFAPGSTWKPMMTAAAMENGYGPWTTLACSSGFQVGNRVFKNFESGAYGYIDFAKALEVSCNTFFYRIGFGYWQKYGSDVADVKAKDPLVSMAKKFGFGQATGIDIPGEATGPDRRPPVEARLLEVDEEVLLQGRQEAGHGLPAPLRPRVLHRGLRLPRRRRGQLRHRPGRHRGDAAPARPRVRRAGQRRDPLRAARGQGDRQPRRQGPQAVRTQGPGQGAGEEGHPALHRQRAEGRRAFRHHGVAPRGLPPRQGHRAGQDRLGRGLRQADDVVGGVVHQGLRRADDRQPGRHRARARPVPTSARSGSSSTASRGEKVSASKAAIAGTAPPARLPTFARDGSILPPSTSEPARRGGTNDRPADEPTLGRPQPRGRAPAGLAADRHRRADHDHRDVARLVGDLQQRDPHPR